MSDTIHPEPITITNLQVFPAIQPNESEITLAALLVAQEDKSEPKVYDAVLNKLSESPTVEQDLLSGKQQLEPSECDTVAVQGIAHDASAGSLEKLEFEAGGADVWNTIRLRTIGPGTPRSGNGSTIDSSAAGNSGSGKGKADIAGNGSGLGTIGATGKGIAGVNGAGRGMGTAGSMLGVEPLRMDMGAYPEKARREGREGVVKLRIEVLADGKIGEVIITESSGYSDLDRSAQEAARKWRFKPARLNGESVVAWVRVPVRYTLSNIR